MPSNIYMLLNGDQTKINQKIGINNVSDSKKEKKNAKRRAGWKVTVGNHTVFY